VRARIVRFFTMYLTFYNITHSAVNPPAFDPASSAADREPPERCQTTGGNGGSWPEGPPPTSASPAAARPFRRLLGTDILCQTAAILTNLSRLASPSA
jgi:hypothetical protein